MEGGHLASHPKKGRKTGARIAFSDEAAFSDKPMVRKTWAPQGKTPILRTPGGRSTRSVISAITCTPDGQRPHAFFQLWDGPINTDIFLAFLREFKRHVRGGKHILILDNLNVHKAKAVQDALVAEHHWLTVEYLPPYAPELNPTEYLWSSKKRKDFSNVRIDGSDALEQRIIERSNRYRKDTALLKGFLRASGLYG